ncbi:HyaD/HybD family hydrogenase maturation endopeptidase [Motiliproteus sp. SC1-56]|uniref:HyaD/HybD family hydrogenase maturation endopeptidase n=1 Tax=Motiliproteus sp. SC1-56 TaxID=2799565 RepID=UPI001A8D8DF4|nr:HyaD/HybD family hydrogenase maturation endopeptidase [Motiliproteus sp. SC1-56]
MSILVLGVGNILLTDEGIGVRVVEALEQRYRIPAGVEVMDGGTAGMELLASMADRDHVILVDAVNTGAAPGTLVRLVDDEVPALFKSKISPHQLGISDLLGVLTVTGEMPKRMTLFGVVPFSLETSTELSEAMQPKLDELVDLTVAELEALGHPLKPCVGEAV